MLPAGLCPEEDPAEGRAATPGLLLAEILASTLGLQPRLFPAQNIKVETERVKKIVFIKIENAMFSKARGRNDFKSEPCKLTTIEGWLVMVPDNQAEAEVTSFQLADPVMRNVYR